MKQEAEKQRSELTFKHNLEEGRHGWLRLTPAYSLKMVKRCLPEDGERKILDPFSGSGTTPLFSAFRGHDAYALELNPFLVWFTKAKTAQYSTDQLGTFRKIGQEILEEFKTREADQVDPPPIHDIERWWNDAALDFLSSVKWSIEKRTDVLSEAIIDLLYVSFCKTLIKISSASFNHQSMSFDDDESQPDLFDVEDQYMDIFESDVNFVADSAEDNPPIEPDIIQGDAREVDEHVDTEMDMVITSPPYANRMSYIRELRPYMYWLEYIVEASEAGELDWDAIGGTWGVATSRLSDWNRDEENGYYPDYLKEKLSKIESDENRNGHKMSNYVARYFEDTLSHFGSLKKRLKSGSPVYYVIGNSTFYDVLIPTEKIYKEIMENVGFEDVSIEKVRKRNSKRELYEFIVSGISP